jgi:hypothetical protein
MSTRTTPAAGAVLATRVDALDGGRFPRTALGIVFHDGRRPHERGPAHVYRA